MKYADRKRIMEELNPEMLVGKKGAGEQAEGYYRWHIVTLLADIADQISSVAYAYNEMLKIQQNKLGGPGPGPQRQGPPQGPQGGGK